MPQRKKILILGGGPAGLVVAKKLAKWRENFEIILVDQNENFNFLPRLFSRGRPIAYRKIAYFLNINFAHAAVIRVDLIAKTVFLKSKISGAIKTVPYDYLVFALGGEGNFYQIPGLEKHCYNLYSLPSARAFEEKLNEIFKKGAEAVRPFDLVIGGAGATGVEAALLLTDYFRKQNWDFLTGEGKIYLYESGEEILRDWPQKIKDFSRRELHLQNIELRTKNVVAETIGKLVASGKKNFLLWAGGRRGNPLFETIPGLKLDTNNFIITNESLELDAHPEIKIVRGENLEMIITDAKIIASNFYREERFLDKRKKEKRKPSVYLFPLAGKTAATQIGPILLTGYFGWLANRLVTLYYLINILPLPLAWQYWKRIK